MTLSQSQLVTLQGKTQRALVAQDISLATYQALGGEMTIYRRRTVAAILMLELSAALKLQARLADGANCFL